MQSVGRTLCESGETTFGESANMVKSAEASVQRAKGLVDHAPSAASHNFTMFAHPPKVHILLVHINRLAESMVLDDLARPSTRVATSLPSFRGSTSKCGDLTLPSGKWITAVLPDHHPRNIQ